MWLTIAASVWSTSPKPFGGHRNVVQRPSFNTIFVHGGGLSLVLAAFRRDSVDIHNLQRKQTDVWHRPRNVLGPVTTSMIELVEKLSYRIDFE
jgi:hypothetical protein